MGEELGHFLSLLSRPLALGGSDSTAISSVARPAPVPPEAPAVPSAAQSSIQTNDRARPHRPAERWLSVSDHTVLSLVQAGKVPQAVPVPAQAGHPSGLKLSRVSSFGIGLQEGDILFEVSGVPVSSQQQIADRVLAARARHDGAIGARLWRNGETIALVVGMPYLDPAQQSQR